MCVCTNCMCLLCWGVRTPGGIYEGEEDDDKEGRMCVCVCGFSLEHHQKNRFFTSSRIFLSPSHCPFDTFFLSFRVSSVLSAQCDKLCLRLSSNKTSFSLSMVSMIEKSNCPCSSSDDNSVSFRWLEFRRELPFPVCSSTTSVPSS